MNAIQPIVMTKTPSTAPDQAELYMLQRLLDCCLRENVCHLSQRAVLVKSDSVPSALLALHDDFSQQLLWLKIPLRLNVDVWLPVQPALYMQCWKVALPMWVLHENNNWQLSQSAQQWLGCLSETLQPDQREYFLSYVQEYQCAIEHLRWARKINRPNLSELKPGWLGSQNIEQLAAHRDHPFYPTARAKSGLTLSDLDAYAPEAMNTFELAWLAVPREAVSGDSCPFTPTFEQVGLPEQARHRYRLVPIHPMTAEKHLNTLIKDVTNQLKKQYPFAEEILIAPKRALSVRATLSVRTVRLVDHPHIHVKLPLLMRSLGHRNLRLIDPKTQVDGFVFQTLLQSLEAYEPLLKGRFRHCNEQLGGHVLQRSDLSWIIREYPPVPESAHIASVASLLACDDQGTLVIEALAANYYGGDLDKLLTEYIDLQLRTHLTLWLKYGVALESNQQNSMLVFEPGQPLSLMFRDNDSGRIFRPQLEAVTPELTTLIERFEDPRLFVRSADELMHMFMTITLQLNLTAIISGLADAGLLNEQLWFDTLAEAIKQQLALLSQNGIHTQPADDALFQAKFHPVKYLLLSGSLLSKQDSGAADINKYYGMSAPNPWLGQPKETGHG